MLSFKFYRQLNPFKIFVNLFRVRKIKKNQVALLLFLFPVVAVGVLYFFGFFDYLHFENLKKEHYRLETFYIKNPFLTMGIFFFTYVFISSFSLPFTALMTLTGGFIIDRTSKMAERIAQVWRPWEHYKQAGLQ